MRSIHCIAGSATWPEHWICSVWTRCSRRSWTEQQVNSELETILKTAFDALVDAARENALDYLWPPITSLYSA